MSTIIAYAVAYVYDSDGLQSLPVNVYFSSSIESDAAAKARCLAAMATWNDTCFAYDVLVYKGSTTERGAVADGFNTVYSAIGDYQYLGLTVLTKEDKGILWWKKTYVVEFDMNLNKNVFWYKDSSETGLQEMASQGYLNYYDMQSVALHEFGHVLGLGHPTSDTVNGVRNAMADTPPMTIVRNISEEERVAIVNLY